MHRLVDAPKNSGEKALPDGLSISADRPSGKKPNPHLESVPHIGGMTTGVFRN